MSCALELSGLQAPDITVWTAWDGEAVAGYARSHFSQFLHLPL